MSQIPYKSSTQMAQQTLIKGDESLASTTSDVCLDSFK